VIHQAFQAPLAVSLTHFPQAAGLQLQAQLGDHLGRVFASIDTEQQFLFSESLVDLLFGVSGHRPPPLVVVKAYDTPSEHRGQLFDC
jgi:hypothetical protein